MTNRAFEDLQRRCKKINQKRVLKVFLIFILMVAVASITIFESYYNKPAKRVIVTQKIVKPTTVKPKVVKKSVVQKQEYDTIVLKPTIVIPKVEVNKTVVKKTELKPKVTPVKLIKPIKSKVQNIKIKVTSLRDEQSLLKDNQSDENFNSTLNLAKYYYKKSKYEKVIYFAKKANRFKPSSFIPWEYYAKAKIKQNKKAEAVEAIRQYLSYFDSDLAIKMLQEIRSKK